VVKATIFAELLVLPTLVRSLNPLSQTEMPGRLEKLYADEKDQEVKVALQDLRDSIR